MESVTLSPSNGTLQLRTDVAGSAAKMGHRLLIEIPDWDAVVDFEGQTPTTVRLSARLAGLQVISGEGGVKPLTGGDRKTIAENAAKSLAVAKHPTVEFASDSVTARGADWEVAGSLTIAGTTKPISTPVIVADAGDHWDVSTTVAVQQTDYGVKPYAAMLGQLRVGDVVQVDFKAAIAK